MKEGLTPNEEEKADGPEEKTVELNRYKEALIDPEEDETYERSQFDILDESIVSYIQGLGDFDERKICIDEEDANGEKTHVKFKLLNIWVKPSIEKDVILVITNKYLYLFEIIENEIKPIKILEKDRIKLSRIVKILRSPRNKSFALFEYKDEKVPTSDYFILNYPDNSQINTKPLMSEVAIRIRRIDWRIEVDETSDYFNFILEDNPQVKYDMFTL